MVKQTPYSIGYVELLYASQNKLSCGAVKNASGAFVKASVRSVGDAATVAIKEMPADFRVSITNPPGERAYPISSFTWALVPAKIADPGCFDPPATGRHGSAGIARPRRG